LDGAAAAYLVAPEIKTPMNWQVLAVVDGAALDTLPAATSGTRLDWGSLLETLEKRS
jgi:hypothetical protein